MTINQISYRDIDIDITYTTTKGIVYLEWSFVYKGNRYANAIKYLEDKKKGVKEKKNQFIGAIATVVANACKTYEDLLANEKTQCEPTLEK